MMRKPLPSLLGDDVLATSSVPGTAMKSQPIDVGRHRHRSPRYNHRQSASAFVRRPRRNSRPAVAAI